MSRDDRYQDLGLLGRGGMGEVRRVRDTQLNRVVALKRVRADAHGPDNLRRFLQEVQTTAGLQHPGIVGVYDAGRTEEGDVYFTMGIVEGAELSSLITGVHEVSGDRWQATADGWSLRRLVTVLSRAAHAVAYAHEQGVVHRDLKPANVMVGRHGEVRVMDWGLAKVSRPGGAPEPLADAVPADVHATRVGKVVGTPSYMAPEQARGDLAAIDERTDVYALGAILYEILTGNAPYGGSSGEEVVAKVLAGPPPRPSLASQTQVAGTDTFDWFSDDAADPITDELALQTLPVPSELEAACLRAMDRDRGRRYARVTDFARDLEAWLDGSRQREVARAMVAEAHDVLAEVRALSERAGALRDEAVDALASVPSWAPEEHKRAGWALQAKAEELAIEADLRALARDRLLAGALTHAPDLPEAHAVLASDQLARHRAAEADLDAAEAARAEVLLRAHLEALPPSDPTRQRGAAYLSGLGAVSLVTDPDGAEVELHRFVPHGRRLITERVSSLGRTPLCHLSLDHGSYLLVLRHPERHTVHYPVNIERGQHWDGVRPGDTEPTPIHLPARGELGTDDCYVPAGTYLAGHAHDYSALPHRSAVWAHAFVVRRYPVTNAEYLAFLDHLVAHGDEELALRHVPRERGAHGEPGRMIYGRDDAGRFVLTADGDGDVWAPDMPVVMVDKAGAQAYARWLADATKQPWRLPWELEWEKAARGVDGRRMPWGNGFDPSYGNMRDSLQGRALPLPVRSFPIDISVYGVAGMAGNVVDWCADDWIAQRPTPTFVTLHRDATTADSVQRGGSWMGYEGSIRSANRSPSVATGRDYDVGFRLARPYP